MAIELRLPPESAYYLSGDRSFRIGSCHDGFVPRCEHLGWTMRAVVAAAKEIVTGYNSLIDHAVPEVDGAAQVGHAPGLPIGRRSARTKERAQRGLTQLDAEVGDPVAGPFGAGASRALIGECSDSAGAIGTTPEHQAGARRTCDLGDLLGRIAQTIQANCLQAGAKSGIASLLLGGLE